MAAPNITPLPTPPSRSQSPSTFSTDADAFLGALPTFQSEANAQADYLDTLATNVTAETGADAAAAAASAAAAAASANIAAAVADYQGAYNPATTYQIGQSVSYNGSLFVANTVNTGVEPVDGANWYLIENGDVVGPASATDGALVAFDGASGTLIKAAGTVTAAQGGTGLTSAGTAGNLLTSDGTNWISAAPPASGPSLEAIASGTLADGSIVIVNADGTVSVVAGQNQVIGSAVTFQASTTQNLASVYDPINQKVIIAYKSSSAGRVVVGTVSGETISFGTVQTFVSLLNFNPSLIYDSVNQKVIIAYVDMVSGAQDNLGTARVGTVSGTSISFGTPVVFNPAKTAWVSAAYDANAQKVVISYRDDGNSGFGTAIVGIVSGTSISFGAEVVFASQSIFLNSATYDSNAQKVVIAYSNIANSQFGTAIVGTVSGTSISFGTAVVFESAITNNISATYDANAQKVVIAYTDSGNSAFGTAIVGTVSGTSISFGTAVVFRSAVASVASATYDTNAQIVIIAYQDGGNSNFGTVIVGTVSGTSISFDTPVVFAAANTTAATLTYDASEQKTIISYVDGSASSHGKALVYQPLITNLTAENFIGFSDGAYSNGQTATIQLSGAVDDAQSGLTAGQSYFVQADGTLGLTAGIPSVFAGTAVSATKIIVKG